MKLPSDQKFFVFDAEAVGLHGDVFAVAGGIYDTNGAAIREFAGHCIPSRDFEASCPERDEEDRKWVMDNVTTSQMSLEFLFENELMTFFWNEWECAKRDFPGILMFVECGWPVEASWVENCILADAEANQWRGPYPMHEIATLMLAAGMDPMATYERQDNELPAHEPLADARLSARLLSEAMERLNRAYWLTEHESQTVPLLHSGDEPPETLWTR